MRQEAPISLSLRDKITNTSLAFSLAFTLGSPQLDPEYVCETSIVRSHVELEEAPLLGFTFRSAEAESVGLDPKFAMEEVLKMGFDQVRIAMYPNQPIEQMVKEVKWQVELAEKYNTDVILVLGRKAPGWPEEYLPRDAHDETLEKTKAVLEAVGHHEQVKVIQVSNEPLYDDADFDPEDPELISDMLDLILPYNKMILFTSHADPIRVRTEAFQEVLSLGKAGGIDVYIETSAGRGSCVGYSFQLQKYDEIAKNAKKPLLVTEMQTLPWPDQIKIPIPGRSALILPYGAQKNLEASEIQKLYKMVLMNTDAESIFFWEMVKNLSAEQKGDPQRMNEIRRILDRNHETREQLYQGELEHGGVTSFSYDHSRLGSGTFRLTP